MSPTLLVATREFTERLRSRAFIVSNFTILALLALGLALPTLAGGDEPVAIGHVGDDAAAVGELARAQQSAFDVEIELVAVDGRPAAEAALEAGELDAVLLDATTVLVEGDLPPRVDVLLATAASSAGIEAALAAAGVDPEERAALFAIEGLAVERVDGTDDRLTVFNPAVMVVFVAVFLLYGLLAVFGQFVAQGIVEEKQSRVVEVLLASVRPTELLAGKVIGLGTLGLAQILALAAIGAGGLLVTDVVEVPAAAWGGLGLLIPWYVLGFLLYAALFAMAGALVSRVEDMQSAVMPVIVVLVLALFGAQLALGDPTSALATVAGLFPLTAPMVQPVLYAMGAASWLQMALAIGLALATIALLLPLAARVYRRGVLHTRGRIALRDAVRAPAGAGRAP
jgi:ABC-2 type transport system permease protein